MFTWILFYVAGGIAAFFTLWYFMISPVYAGILGGRAAFAYPLTIGAAYLALTPLSENSLPVAVLWGRAAVIRASGLVVGLVSHARARSATIARQNALERERAELLYEAVVEDAADAIVGISPDLRIRVSNQRAEEMFGHRSDAIRAAPVLSLISPEDRDQVRQDIIARFTRNGAGATGRPIRVHGQRLSGETFPVEASFGLVTATGFEMVIAVVRDVTEQVRAQRQLRDLVASKDEFIASVSHELRTPLTSVLGFTEILRESGGEIRPEEVSSYLTTVNDQAIEMSNIVEDLLVAGRPDLEDLFITVEPVELRQEIEAVIAAGESALELSGKHVEMTGGPVTALADQTRTRQIIRNLLRNAMVYGGDSVKVSVSTKASRALLEVADDGDKLSSEEVDVIFEPYQRAHDRAGQPGSVGLGLTVSRALARRMGGDVTHVRRGERTVFTLDLPLSPEPPTTK